jgi:formylglycine-generating enzyme required for sulfatase activity
MADVFISYAKEDRASAERLSRALERHGFSVWWDREILAGADFYNVISDELHAAACVVVIWSKHSTASRWVRDEAREGLERNALVPVLIDAIEPPMGFGSIHAEDLSGWTGGDDHPGLTRLIKAVSHVSVSGSTRPVQPAGVQDHRQGTAQPLLSEAGRLDRTAEEGRRARRRMILVVAAIAVLAAAAAIAASTLIEWKDEAPRRNLVDGREVPMGRIGEPYRDCPQCPEMVPLAPGWFRMGASWLDREAQSDERPIKEIVIDYSFAIGRTEVSFAEWQACVDDGGCHGYVPDDYRWGRGARPAIFVSWDDAQTYVDWLRGKTGKDYRLASEAEWEFACRAGTESKYPFGDEITPVLANYDRNEGKTKEVGSYPANAWGIHDMNGNVWEWVEDVWHDSHSGRPTDGKPRLEGADPQDKVVRGGSWDDRPRRARCISRNGKDRDQRENEIGFRVALTL